ncbi:2592_t:CDS:2, partial [Ambispora gerdemannii]
MALLFTDKLAHAKGKLRLRDEIIDCAMSGTGDGFPCTKTVIEILGCVKMFWERCRAGNDDEECYVEEGCSQDADCISESYQGG